MKKLVFAPLALLFLFACKKEKDEDNNNNNCPVSMASLSGTYKIQSIKYKANSAAPEIDVFGTFDDCQKDDLYTLNENGTATYEDAGVECGVNGDDTGTWSLSGNTVNISVGGEAITGTLQSFDCTNLIVVTENYMGPGDKATFTIRKQ